MILFKQQTTKNRRKVDKKCQLFLLPTGVAQTVLMNFKCGNKSGWGISRANRRRRRHANSKKKFFCKCKFFAVKYLFFAKGIMINICDKKLDSITVTAEMREKKETLENKVSLSNKNLQLIVFLGDFFSVLVFKNFGVFSFFCFAISS